jgi:hypothetical protein
MTARRSTRGFVSTARLVRRVGSDAATLPAYHGHSQRLQAWTRMRFPESGEYVFPGGLATLHVDFDWPRPILRSIHHESVE